MTACLPKDAPYSERPVSPRGGLLWQQIQSIVPNESLHLTGQLAPPFGGPATSLLRLALEGDGDSTILKVTDCLFGNVDEATRGNIEVGWRRLYGDGLGKYVESLPRTLRSDRRAFAG